MPAAWPAARTRSRAQAPRCSPPLPRPIDRTRQERYPLLPHFWRTPQWSSAKGASSRGPHAGKGPPRRSTRHAESPEAPGPARLRSQAKCESKHHEDEPNLLADKSFPAHSTPPPIQNKGRTGGSLFRAKGHVKDMRLQKLSFKNFAGPTIVSSLFSKYIRHERSMGER